MTVALAPELPRARRAVVAFLATVTLVVAGAPVLHAAARMVSVIVISADPVADVSDAGGIVDTVLPIVHGVRARVPAGAIGSMRATVVPNYPLHVQSASFEARLSTAYPREVRAPSAWSRGLTGEGVTVAVVDTGIAGVADVADRVVAEANFTNEPTFTDTYGHGTFQAGLIAGNGTSSNGRFVGVAPEVSLMSIKVAGRDGDTSLGQVLSGLQLVDWSASRFNVRVALLALSSGSPLPPELDPLTIALRRLWAHGVTVVVPSGNDPDTITSPGEDPVLLTAGSVDDRGTGDVADDAVSSFTGRGPTRWNDDKPDVAAPGEHLVSLRAPGSTVDTENPSSRVEDAYFKGSGTSMSAAVTAGAAALISQAHPDASPDAVKAMLMGTAQPFAAGDASAAGAGVIDVDRASSLDPNDIELPPAPDVDDATPPATPPGLGFSWVGERPARWMSAKLAGRTWNGRTWDSRTWNGRTWTEEEWDARSWAMREWAGRTWDSRSWNARTWDSRSWAGRTWASRSWAGRTWASRTWASRTWSSRTWSADDWASRTWTSRTWSSRTWSDEQWDSRTWSSRTWSSRSWSSRSWSSRSWD